MDKENCNGSGSRLYSPSLYRRSGLADRTNSSGGAVHMKKRRSSLMDMLSEAHEEVKIEKTVQADRALAARVQGEEAKRAAEIEAQERASELFAQKLECEERDAMFAEKVEEQEHRQLMKQRQSLEKQSLLDAKAAKDLLHREERDAVRRRKQLAKQSKRDMKLAKRMLKDEEREVRRAESMARKEEKRLERQRSRDEILARKIQQQEEKKEAQLRRQHEEDMRLARQMQHEELGEVGEASSLVRESWSNPTVNVEESKCGTLISVQLPNVRRMEVDLDEEENCIFVSAIPKSVGRVAEKVVVAKADEAHEEVRRIVEHNIGELRPVNFEIHLDELVDGTVVAEDIHSEYIADEGLLRLELMGVAAIPQKRQQNFKKSLLGRLTSMFRRRGSGSKAQEGTKARKK